MNPASPPEQWQCAVNAPMSIMIKNGEPDWCFLEQGHKGAHSWARGANRGKIITYTVYAHSNKDSLYEKARDAGLTDEEWEKLDKLQYIGYEMEIEVTVNRETGEIKTKVIGEP